MSLDISELNYRLGSREALLGQGMRGIKGREQLLLQFNKWTYAVPTPSSLSGIMNKMKNAKMGASMVGIGHRIEPLVGDIMELASHSLF